MCVGRVAPSPAGLGSTSRCTHTWKGSGECSGTLARQGVEPLLGVTDQDFHVVVNWSPGFALRLWFSGFGRASRHILHRSSAACRSHAPRAAPSPPAPNPGPLTFTVSQLCLFRKVIELESNSV